MNAIIMAGGKGTRLHPLTCNIPKPMIPLLNRPCMEYIIELLVRHGITKLAVTTQYLSHVIRAHFGDGSRFGAELRYFEEVLPLGTAGSVKSAQEFLDGDEFLVTSGDVLTDFDLSSAIQYHREKRAIVTLVTTQVEDPTLFGVVMTDIDGKILRFREKPRWSEAFSNTVNTGIYILQREVLSYIKEGVPFDFSRDLFPLLLRLGQPLYAYAAQGYWSDVGTPVKYSQTQFDMLDGKVKVRLDAKEIAPEIWVEGEIIPDKGAKISGPAYIGRGARLHKGVKVEEYSVIGRDSLLLEGASVRRAILWNGVQLASKNMLSWNGSNGKCYCNRY